MEHLKFNITAFTHPKTLAEADALLDEVLSMVDELGVRLAAMGATLAKAECARA